MSYSENDWKLSFSYIFLMSFLLGNRQLCYMATAAVMQSISYEDDGTRPLEIKLKLTTGFATLALPKIGVQKYHLSDDIL